MMKRILLFLFLALHVNLVQAQTPTFNQVDSLVALAISLSEKSLYGARFKEAKKIVGLSYFQNFDAYNQKHEILLTVQDIRVEGFMNNLYLLDTDYTNNFKRLNKLLPIAKKLEDKNTQAEYFLLFSSSHRSLGNIDSAMIYEQKATLLFSEGENHQKLAIIRAGNISRLHNQLLREGKKKKILALIPKYQTEIDFSTKHSKYALAYNTRHLAQIHRRQTLNYKESLKLFSTSLSLREEIGFKPFIPASYSSLGDVYLKMDEYNSAIKMYQKSVALAEEIGFVRYQSYPLLKIGDCYLKQNDMENAIEYYTKALRNASGNNYSIGIDQAIEKIRNLKIGQNKK